MQWGRSHSIEEHASPADARLNRCIYSSHEEVGRSPILWTTLDRWFVARYCSRTSSKAEFPGGTDIYDAPLVSFCVRQSHVSPLLLRERFLYDGLA